jgi:ketosteroid isomerase-like protein
MTAELEQRLAVLEAERAILRTLHAYGSAIDYGREDEYRDCWLEDAVLHWPRWPPMEGQEAIIDAFRRHTHAPAVYHKHVVVDPQIEVSGDTATVESYFAFLGTGPEGPYLGSFGRYLDVLVRCQDGRWRFKERRAQVEALRPAG